MGRFGDIRGMMAELAARSTYLDLRFCCDDGALDCHKFVIGAQSKFLRRILERTSAAHDEDVSVVALPGVKAQSLKTVLKFLYTGRLVIRRDQVHSVKELLERVLMVDARITLPEMAPPPANRPDDDGNDGGGGGSGGGPSNGHGNQENRSCPPKKRFRPSEDDDPPNSNDANGLNGGDDSARHAPLAPPLSPPHSLNGGDDDVMECIEDVVAEASPAPEIDGVESPEVVEVVDAVEDNVASEEASPPRQENDRMESPEVVEVVEEEEDNRFDVEGNLNSLNEC